MSSVLLRGETTDKKKLEREQAFKIATTRAPLPLYDSLRDHNLQAFWSNPGTRRHLTELGFLDDTGNIIDLDQYRRKLHVIHKELEHAEKMAHDAETTKSLEKRDQAIKVRRQDVWDQRTEQIRMRKTEAVRRREERSALSFNASRSLLSSTGSHAVASTKSLCITA
jgi:hypothetical protein